ncbi:MAG TPA: hypothetical protein VFO79_03495 [Xanthomonadales bacterium]|nr:hypothetical protein [Xanthomonadales bacterium]
MGYEGLKTGLAERQAPGSNSFKTDPKTVRAWADALPLANASATARLLYNALRETNALRIDPLQRIHLLETLRMPIQQVADTVDRQIVGSSFPLPPQKRALGDIAQDFQRELALGYRIALVEICGSDGRVPFLRGKPVALALQRLIAHLGAQLAKAYLVYSNPPAGIWQTMHDAFAFARESRLDDKPVEDPLLCNATLTPRDSYSHALLLAVSNPYQFSQRDIGDAYRATQVWASACRIVEQGHDRELQAVALDADRGPGYLHDERRNAGALVVGFETRALEQLLERELQMVRGVSGPISFRLKNAPAVSVHVELLNRLLASWRPPAHRDRVRLPGMYVVETLVGLSSLHYHLAGRMDFDTFSRYGRARSSSQITMSDRPEGANWAVHAEGAHDVFCARVLDHTRHGYRIEWESVEAVRARVGETVGIALPAEFTEEQDWMVGVIRWMRIDGDGRVEAGIELLAREARAAALRAIDVNGTVKPAIRAIRLAPLDDEGEALEHYTVIAPSVIETTAERLELAIAPERYSPFDGQEIVEIADFDVLEHTGTNVRIAPPRPAAPTAAPRRELDRVAG